MREISLGDYVLNGGEVAALAITEAVVRLLPGFMGNAESLVEESHEDGLLEYPVYTKPAVVARPATSPTCCCPATTPRIAALAPRPRRVRRTAERRPDLLPPQRGARRWRADAPAVPADAGELLTLQLACWVQETHDNPGVEIPALNETLDDVRAWLPDWTRAGAPARGTAGRRRPGPPRGRRLGHRPADGRPRPAGPGPGPVPAGARSRRAAPDDVTSYSLFTGAGSLRNQRMYKKAGYRLRGELEPGVVVLTKPRG